MYRRLISIFLILNFLNYFTINPCSQQILPNGVTEVQFMSNMKEINSELNQKICQRIEEHRSTLDPDPEYITFVNRIAANIKKEQDSNDEVKGLYDPQTINVVKEGLAKLPYCPQQERKSIASVLRGLYAIIAANPSTSNEVISNAPLGQSIQLGLQAGNKLFAFKEMKKMAILEGFKYYTGIGKYENYSDYSLILTVENKTPEKEKKFYDFSLKLANIFFQESFVTGYGNKASLVFTHGTNKGKYQLAEAIGILHTKEQKEEWDLILNNSANEESIKKILKRQSGNTLVKTGPNDVSTIYMKFENTFHDLETSIRQDL